MSRDPLEDLNLLGVAPVRRAEWEEAGDHVVLRRPPPSRRGLRALGERLALAMSVPRVRLDEIGSFVWLRLDGRRTVGELARELRAEFGERVEPAEERLGQLVRTLRREGFLAYPGFDPPLPPAPQ